MYNKKEINENGSSNGRGAMITMILHVIFSLHWLTTQEAISFGHFGRKSSLCHEISLLVRNKQF